MTAMILAEIDRLDRAASRQIDGRTHDELPESQL